MPTEVWCAVDNCVFEKDGKCSKEAIKVSYTEGTPDNTEETCCMSFRDERQRESQSEAATSRLGYVPGRDEESHPHEHIRGE